MTKEELEKKLDYNPETGSFTWKGNMKGTKSFSPAGSINDQGYLCIRFNYKIYRAQRLAWILSYGKEPDGVIDHIDGNRLNNKLSNLRDIPKKENQKNLGKNCKSKSGITGVMWHKAGCKWHAQITVNKKAIHLGYFDNIEDAIKARKDANELYGFHENHGERESWRN